MENKEYFANKQEDIPRLAMRTCPGGFRIKVAQECSLNTASLAT